LPFEDFGMAEGNLRAFALNDLRSGEDLQLEELPPPISQTPAEAASFSISRAAALRESRLPVSQERRA
jgi:hypothetical protein